MSDQFILPKNKWVNWPTHTILFDLETNWEEITQGVLEHTLRIGQACYLRWRKGRNKWAEDWCVITSGEDLVDFIETHAYKNTKLYVGSHNLGFDAEVIHLIEMLEDRDWVTKNPIITQNAVIIQMSKDDRKIVLFSTTNIWHCSLDSIGKTVGVPKGKMPPQNAPTSEWAAYNKRDVEVLVVAFKAWLERLKKDNLGGFSQTIASTSMRAFRHRFMTQRIVINHSPEAVELERTAYHGGRTKVYFQGHLPSGSYYDLDLKSAYPSVMRNEPLPWRLAHRAHNIQVDDLRNLLDKYAVIARVMVKTDEPVFPIKYNGHIIYPIGSFVTVLSTPELEYAIEWEVIKKVYKAQAYERAVLFKEFVDYFFNDRLESIKAGNTVRGDQDKRILNSLSGKWGGKIHGMTRTEDVKELELGINRILRGGHLDHVILRRIGQHVWKEENEREAPYSFPAIIGHITAACRMRLWEYQKLIGQEHYFKEETDGFLTDEIGLEKVRDNLGKNELGKLEVSESYHDVVIYAPNDYLLDGERKTKGVRLNAKEINPGTFLQTKFPTMVGRSRKEPYTPYRTYEVEKHLNRVVHDGIVLDNGWVRPLHTSELNPNLLYR